jgi:DNA ligase (NAD+)
MSDATDDHARAIAAQRIDELRSVIREHNRRYYEEDDPSIPDSEWDALMVELKSLEAEYPELDSPDSPSHSVGGAPTVQFAEVVHSLPMMSLDNAFTFAELDSWGQRAARGLGADQTVGPLVCELKFDGLAISIRYEKGRMVRAATRGNGRVGEDVTANVRTIADVPQRLAKGAPAVLEVRGEVYMSLAVFAALNDALTKAGERTYVNPRNTAAGSLRQKDAAMTASRSLSFWSYGVGELQGTPPLQSHHETLEYLASLGLPVNPELRVVDDFAAVRG